MTPPFLVINISRGDVVGCCDTMEEARERTTKCGQVSDSFKDTFLIVEVKATYENKRVWS